jgi:hypothetical protein
MAQMPTLVLPCFIGFRKFGAGMRSCGMKDVPGDRLDMKVMHLFD